MICPVSKYFFSIERNVKIGNHLERGKNEPMMLYITTYMKGGGGRGVQRDTHVFPLFVFYCS